EGLKGKRGGHRSGGTHRGGAGGGAGATATTPAGEGGAGDGRSGQGDGGAARKRGGAGRAAGDASRRAGDSTAAGAGLTHGEREGLQSEGGRDRLRRVHRDGAGAGAGAAAATPAAEGRASSRRGGQGDRGAA